MLSRILEKQIDRIAVVGLAKNVGKTTTFNWMVEEGHRSGYLIGMASIGVDGERNDVWDHHVKPAIEIKKGMWAATAKAALLESTAKYRVVKELKPSSPLGAVYLVECVEDGQIKLAGTQMLKDISSIQEHFAQQGVTLSIIDGAYDRLASASEEIVNGFILCTGAAVDPDLEIVLKKTEEQLVKWQLPRWKRPDREETATLDLDSTVWYRQKGEWKSLESSSLLTGLTKIRLLAAEGVEYVSIPGALTEWALQYFIPCPQPFTWIVADPTKIFLTQESLLRWFRFGGHIMVRNQSKLLALSVNPFSFTVEQDADEWLYRLKELAQDIPVLDARRRKVI